MTSLFQSLVFYTLFLTPLSLLGEDTLSKKHPIYKKLNHLFHQKKNLKFNSTKMLQMGFSIIAHSSEKAVFVATHRNIKGYVFKFFNNPSGTIAEKQALFQRVNGAKRIRQFIEDKKIHQFFKVPQKWVYQIPGKDPHYLLVAEDMHLLSHKKNKEAWKSHKVSKATLEALYTILKQLGLIDSLYIDNIPFNKEGKICFIDTEHYGLYPVHFGILTSSLSPAMQKIWLQLIENQGMK